MKLAKLALVATTFFAPFAANAQDAGTTVYSQIDDSTVGTIESNDGATAILDTGAYKAPLPVGTYAQREGKWTINATKEQIDGMMAAQAAEAEKKLNAALVVGAKTTSADAQYAGTVLAIDGAADQILLKHGEGLVSLKREHFALDGSGQLMALFTEEQLDEFTTEVPEGAEVRTASGDLVDFAGGATSASAASATTGAAE
ncbi:MAG: hypothetical protein QNI87_00315 [Erythrobacter sp.]|uniref:hypothetical protein n=1 Tax=Erythrobacter sp. TaxID=1042 RepID=UPI00260432F4|nr:hypothetical protein [Erythrobacter sp.]MDJ0976959.1 hypothetical protein [Erythrobacter sp.]